MAKQGEIEYLSAIGEGGRVHAMNKPFSDALCGRYLAQVGQIMDLLPVPPARILELGCGTGWTSIMLAKRGYDVFGLDIAPDMIACADELSRLEGPTNLEFAVGDYESTRFEVEFDGVLFFNALHHAEDERAALGAAYAALRGGGVCVVCEPGAGHHKTTASREATERFGVNEKEMPPPKVRALARSIGFSASRVYPHAGQVLPLVSGHDYSDRSGVLGWVLSKPVLRPMVALGVFTALKRRAGVVVLTK